MASEVIDPGNSAGADLVLSPDSLSFIFTHDLSMRRPEKEIHDPAGIMAFLDEAAVLRLALNDDSTPYIVPLCFARLENVLYCHSATKGRKLDLIARDPRVGFEA